MYLDDNYQKLGCPLVFIRYTCASSLSLETSETMGLRIASKLESEHRSAMSILATFAQIPLMRAVTLTRVVRNLDLYSKPSFETICYSFCISSIQYWLSNTVAALAPLMPNYSIVSLITI